MIQLPAEVLGHGHCFQKCAVTPPGLIQGSGIQPARLQAQPFQSRKGPMTGDAGCPYSLGTQVTWARAPGDVPYTSSPAPSVISSGPRGWRYVGTCHLGPRPRLPCTLLSLTPLLGLECFQTSDLVCGAGVQPGIWGLGTCQHENHGSLEVLCPDRAGVPAPQVWPQPRSWSDPGEGAGGGTSAKARPLFLPSSCICAGASWSGP